MIRSSLLRAAGAAALSTACFVPAAASAQAAPAAAAPTWGMAASGRATSVVELTARMPAGTPAASRPAPKRIAIDYGQPHARGRDVAPLIPTTAIWRAGANTSTTMTTDVDLVMGTTTIPAGKYSLYVQRTATGAELVVNRQTGQWGTEYDQKQDVVRVPMRVRTLAQPLDAMQLALVPVQGAMRGVLRIVWGAFEMESDWEAKL